MNMIKIWTEMVLIWRDTSLDTSILKTKISDKVYGIAGIFSTAISIYQEYEKIIYE